MSRESGEYGYRVDDDGTRTISVPVRAFDIALGGMYAAGGAATFASFGNKLAREAFVTREWWDGFWVKFNDVILDGAITSAGAVVMAAGVAVMFMDRQASENDPDYPAPAEYETFTARVPVYETSTEVEAVQLVLLSETYTDLGDQA